MLIQQTRRRRDSQELKKFQRLEWQVSTHENKSCAKELTSYVSLCYTSEMNLTNLLVWLSGYWTICRDILRCLHIGAGVWILAQVSRYWSRCLYISLDAQILVQVSRYRTRFGIGHVSRFWPECQDTGPGFQTLVHVTRCPDISFGICIIVQVARYCSRCADISWVFVSVLK